MSWYVEIVRREPFEDILIGPFDTQEEAQEHSDNSADVEDWCYGEAKAAGYIVEDVFVIENPETIPSYGVNAPVFPVYQPGACIGILPGTR